MLRAIAKYLRQAGSTFSQTYMEDALAAHPTIARRLVELFRLRLDPTRFEDTDAKARALERELETAIDEVASLDEDRILRGFLASSAPSCARTTSRPTRTGRRSRTSRSSSTPS